MSEATVRVTAVSDYICPWCYVGFARIERLRRRFDVEIRWWPFELHSEVPPEGIERRPEPSPQRAALYERLGALATEAGLPFQRPPRVANSHFAVEASEYAREQRAFDIYHPAVFDAYWARGLDIGDAAVLVELAAGAGLDRGALSEALTTRRYARLVDERTAEARSWGVTGTPTFIFESDDRRFPLTGAQDDEVFEQVARRLGATPRTEDERALRGVQGSRF